MVRSTARIRAVGGPHDGGLVEDLGRAYQYIDAKGRAYKRPAPGRLLHHYRGAACGSSPAMQIAIDCGECGGIYYEGSSCPLCGALR